MAVVAHDTKYVAGGHGAVTTVLALQLNNALMVSSAAAKA